MIKLELYIYKIKFYFSNNIKAYVTLDLENFELSDPGFALLLVPLVLNTFLRPPKPSNWQLPQLVELTGNGFIKLGLIGFDSLLVLLLKMDVVDFILLNTLIGLTIPMSGLSLLDNRRLKFPPVEARGLLDLEGGDMISASSSISSSSSLSLLFPLLLCPEKDPLFLNGFFRLFNLIFNFKLIFKSINKIYAQLNPKINAKK